MLPKVFMKRFCINCLRNYSNGASKPTLKRTVQFDETILKDINSEIYKPRKHPGRTLNKNISLPDKFIDAVLNVTKDYPVKSLVASSAALCNHLAGRLPPVEPVKLKAITSNIEQSLYNKYKNVVINTDEEQRKLDHRISQKAAYGLKKLVYNWEPVKYDKYNALLYLLGRTAAEYAVLVKIFAEIVTRDPKFVPRSLFDFGSGVGTGTWATNLYWKGNLFEYYNVDCSADMNDLAESLLNGGQENREGLNKGTFYRQFLPASNLSYDLVISAYSLFELPSVKARLDVVLNLWNKTQNYLVLVEQGTNAGFKIINEARDFILQFNDSAHAGHVFSPCPHDKICPRFVANDGTPCNFEVGYFTMPIGQKSIRRTELYSYIVLKKVKRNPQDQCWPRIVRPVLVRSKHSICRMCTSKGKLEEIIFTSKKNGKTQYHCARSSKWGDFLPLTIEDNDTNKVEEDIINKEENKEK